MLRLLTILDFLQKPTLLVIWQHTLRVVATFLKRHHYAKLRFAGVLLLTFLLSSCTQQLPSSTTDGTALKALLASSTKPAVIKFHAKWCASCKQYAPAFLEVKSTLSETTDFFEIDVDEAANKSLIKELKIARIPETVFVSADRQNVFKRLGPISAADLTRTLNELSAH